MKMRNLLLPAIALLAALGSMHAEASPRKLFRKMSFSQDWSRYPSPDVILATLQMQFPLAKIDSSSASCLIVTPDNRSILGESNPLTGTPSVTNPNSSFVVWYSGCLKDFLKSEEYEFSALFIRGTPAEREALVKTHLSEKTLALCPVDLQGGAPSSKCEWTQLTPAVRISIIESEIERLIGPDEVVRDLTLGTSVNELATRIDSKLSAIIAKNGDAFSFINMSFKSGRPDSVKAIGAVRFLILLADTLKY